MIYVAENTQARQFELLALVASERDCTLVAWLYPESSATELLGSPVVDNDPLLQPVTTYGSGVEPKRTAPIAASSQALAALSAHAAEIAQHCDSLALYHSSEPAWSACTIGHEGMCLVQDHGAIGMLTANGFPASLEAPPWW